MSRRSGVLVAAAVLLPALALAQGRRPPQGHSIGSVSVQGHLIVMTLNPGALGTQNLFNLNHRTLRFTPAAGGYRIANLPLQWDANFGAAVTTASVPIDHFAFPFAGKTWTSISIGTTGSITFPGVQSPPPPPPPGAPRRFFRRFGGLHVARYFQMRREGARLVNTKVPAICAFFKTRMQGRHYVSQRGDRVVITWDLSLPYGGIQDWHWFPTVNRFQAVLYKDGTITLSYDQMAAQDGIVGVYPGAGTTPGTPQQAEVDFATITARQGPFPAAFEAFHFYAEPNPRDLACTVIQHLGDAFDFLAYYSDFRVDNPEAGTPSDGPRGSVGGPVSGIGARNDPGHGGRPGDLASYCSAGRFQWEFVQPVDVNAIQMWQYPPANALPSQRPFDIMAYAAQLRERTQNGKIPPYDYAISQIGHEMDHRWNAFTDAKVDGKIIHLGDPFHWLMGLEARVPFAYQRPTEASIMGGGVWQDNHNGTYTQLDDNYFVPATGYSYLDLYNMGLIAPSEVPDFFLLTHLVPDGHDALGHRIFKADRQELTVQDIIAAEGHRRPDVEHSQKQFNTGMVLVEQAGHKPSRLLVQRVSGIRQQWMKYFATATGHRAVMTTNPR